MTESSLDKVLLVALGWLLGLLGPVIVDAIRRRRDNSAGRAAIYVELRDVAHKLALSSHYIYMHQGTIDRPHLEWLKRHVESYAALIDTDSLLKSIRLQLSWPEPQLIAYVKAGSEQGKKSVALQKYPVPMLDSRVSALWSFNTRFQRQLLEVRTRVELLNELVDRSRKLADMTFTKVEGDNYALIVENLEQCYAQYADGAKRIVDQVRELKYV